MSDLNAMIHRYLRPPDHAFWNWSGDGEAIVWTDDNRTIAFRAELATILRRHVSKGLPRLGPILLLLAACRIQLRPKGKSSIADRLSQEFLLLDRMYELPTELRTDTAAKAELTAMILESDRNRTSVDLADAVVESLGSGFALEFVRQERRLPTTTGVLLFDFEPLREGLKRFDEDAFKLRLSTGIEQEILPAEIEEPLSVKVRKLLDRLQTDEEFAGLARLARNLMALVHLPKPLGQPDEIPVGGVSDIANRGSLDRLLLSELAQDDDLLMMRLAMNEAMFLRRETPPKDPPRMRFVIIDTTIRTWGTPRVMAAAVAMSFAAMNGPADLHVLRGDADTLVPSDLSTREGLIEHLNLLDPNIHPGGALADLSNWIGTEEYETDVVLVTSNDVLADKDFKEWLKEFGAPIQFLASVSREGNYRLLERTKHGVRPLREAHFEIDRLLAPPKKPVLPLKEKHPTRDLPLILSLPTFPLRLPHYLNPDQTWSVRHHGVLSITNDRRLMHWDNPNWAGRQLTDQLDSRRLIWCQTRAENGCTHFVCGKASQPNLQLGIVDVEHGHCELVPLETSKTHVHTVCEHAGMLFVVHPKAVDVCDIASGERIHVITIPRGYRWSQGRFFREGPNWKALSFDGVHPWFENVKTNAVRAVARLFDVEGIQGPVGIGIPDDGDIGVFTADQFLPLPVLGPYRILAVSPDGRRVLLEHGQGDTKRKIIFDIVHQSARPARDVASLCLNSEIWESVEQRQLRSRFRAIGAHGAGLLLKTPKGSGHVLGYDLHTNQFRLTPFKISENRVTPLRRFEPVPAPPGAGFHLAVATWGDGSRAFLDSRGLLHLKSSDPEIPEATFFLSDDFVAGWCSTGEVWGGEYFHGETPSANPMVIHIKFLGKFLSRLQS